MNVLEQSETIDCYGMLSFNAWNLIHTKEKLRSAHENPRQPEKIEFGIYVYVYIQIPRSIGPHSGQHIKKLALF